MWDECLDTTAAKRWIDLFDSSWRLDTYDMNKTRADKVYEHWKLDNATTTLADICVADICDAVTACAEDCVADICDAVTATQELRAVPVLAVNCSADTADIAVQDLDRLLK